MTTDSIKRVSQETQLGNASSSTAQDAALRGASLAFGKPPVKPKPKINTYSGNNGALAAATKVGGGALHERNALVSRLDTQGDETRLRYQSTGGSVGNVSHVGDSVRSISRQRMSRLDSSGFLQPPGPATEQARSPSFIAATVAASRSASVSPNPTGQQVSAAELRRQSNFTRGSPSRRSSSRESSDHALDTTSIPATTSLIGIFEKTAKLPEQGRRPPVRRTATAMARSPVPQRPKSPLLTKTRTPSPSPSRTKRTSLPTESRSPSHLTSKPSKPEVKTPKPLRAKTSGNTQQSDPPKPSPVPGKTHIIPSKPIPIPSKSTSPKLENNAESSSSNDSFVSASDHKPSPSFRAALANQHRHLTSASAVSVNSSATIDSMANAIVASSLASSRAASPSKQLSLQPPPPPPSRRSPRSHLFHNNKEMSRTPSPAKQSNLRTTMRKPKTEEEVDEGDKRRSKKHIMKKHPNKHHEGDRKRWRDEITERERKRYEAVWASNKGLYTSSSYPGSEYSVCNLVVRDIFSRSRLHADVLEEVYALIDKQQNGSLEKEEFVVGLWLIDQRLKGRKLPIRVSDHVWRSVGSGIKVRKAGK